MLLLDRKPLLGKLPLWTPNPAGIPQPVGAWIMNERSGGKIYDLSGNGNDGTFGNDPAWVPGRTGPTLDFDGGDDYVDIPDSVSLNDAGGFEEMTLSVWINPHDLTSTAQWIVSKDTSGSNTGDAALILNRSEEIGVQFYEQVPGKSTTIATSDLTANNWHHIVFTKDASGMGRIYLNGIEKHSLAGYTNDLWNNTTNVQIGSVISGTYSFDGLIDDVLIYNQALTPAQIVYLHQHPYYAWEYPEVWEYYVAAVGAVAPTGALYGPLVGPMGGPI